MALDSSGNLYVADTNDFRVAKINSAGVVQGWIGYGKTTGAGNGHCPASTGGTTTGWCLGGSTKAVQSTVAGGFGLPAWVAVDPSGFLWVADNVNSRIEKFNASTGAYLASFPIVSQTSALLSMGLDGNGKSLITYEWYLAAINTGAKSFVRYSLPSMNLLGEAGYFLQNQPTGNGQLGCSSLTLGAPPALWCVPEDPTQQSIVSWEDNTSWAASPASQIVVDSSNSYMYFVDHDNGKLARIPLNR
jgi:hypothetical protein